MNFDTVLTVTYHPLCFKDLFARKRKMFLSSSLSFAASLSFSTISSVKALCRLVAAGWLVETRYKSFDLQPPPTLSQCNTFLLWLVPFSKNLDLTKIPKFIESKMYLISFTIDHAKNCFKVNQIWVMCTQKEMRGKIFLQLTGA